MQKTPKNLVDIGTERALLGTIMHYGKDSFIDANGLVDSTDFSEPLNRMIFTTLEHLAEDEHCEVFDVESVLLKGKILGFGKELNTVETLEYLDVIANSYAQRNNTEMFSMQVKKTSVIRNLYEKYHESVHYLQGVRGNEPLSEVIGQAEGIVSSYINNIESGTSVDEGRLGDGIAQYVEQMMNQKPVDQIGIPTGFNTWDDLIGGGLRRGTVSIIGARPKAGKSFHALNVALNVAKNQNIPVLFLDLELTKEYQQSRMICIDSGCPLKLYETGQFQNNEKIVDNVLDSVHRINNLPLWYKQAGGMSLEEILSYAKRWIVKNVGFNEQGKANDCVIIYDYVKLTDGAGLSKHTPEYILLGLMLTKMHNFATRYGVAMLTYVQLNRDGISSQETNVIAGSDRILWLCSNFSIFKNKDEDDNEMGCGWEEGNKKMIVIETRQGSGHENENDYININASLKPNISSSKACGSIIEGRTFVEACKEQF